VIWIKFTAFCIAMLVEGVRKFLIEGFSIGENKGIKKP
jgi:hypothetical protein